MVFHSNFPEKSINLFIDMRRKFQVRPDEFSLPLVLWACADLGLVKLEESVHGLCVKMGWEVSLVIGSASISCVCSFW